MDILSVIYYFILLVLRAKHLRISAVYQSYYVRYTVVYGRIRSH